MKNFEFPVFIFAGIVYLANSRIVKGLASEGIFKGYPAGLGQFKYQVSVHVNGKFMCGGGILGDQYVITVAHCIANETTGKIRHEPFTIQAISTTHSAHALTLSILVVMVFLPTDYKPVNPNPNSPYRTYGDLAILKLEHNLGVKSNPLLTKLKLPDPKLIYSDRLLVITGFGYNDVYDSHHPVTMQPMKIRYCDGKLRFALTEIVRNKICTKLYPNPIHSGNICARVLQKGEDTPKGVCLGDSGSPLVHNGETILGVLSAGPASCVEDERPGVYTKILFYVNAINTVMSGKRTSKMRSFAWTMTNRALRQFQFIEV